MTRHTAQLKLSTYRRLKSRIYRLEMLPNLPEIRARINELNCKARKLA